MGVFPCPDCPPAPAPYLDIVGAAEGGTAMVMAQAMGRVGLRRTGAVLIAAAMLGAMLPAGAGTPPGDLPFTVYRNGDSPMGVHQLSFREEGDALVMEKRISFQVRFAFITAYRYEHRNREVWRDGRLVELETTTNDDGTQHWVRGRATEAGFAVESSGGPVLAAAGIVPTSYWNIDLIRATQLLDTQRGLLMDVRVEPLGVEPIRVEGGVVEARHFRIHILTNKPGTTDHIDIWYDDDDRWVKLAFQARGQQILYRLEGEGADARSAALTP